MRIVPLHRKPEIYTCNAYLILGDWNLLSDVNTLIDPGADGYVTGQIDRISTGCGKHAVDQVILTHDHFDHAGGVAEVQRKYGCRILAANRARGVDRVLNHGDRLQCGDRWFEVIAAPFHSNDSICLYCEEDGVLFSGDTPLRVLHSGGSYTAAYLEFLTMLSMKPIDAIFSGHDQVLTDDPGSMLRQSASLVRAGLGNRSCSEPPAHRPAMGYSPGIFPAEDNTGRH